MGQKPIAMEQLKQLLQLQNDGVGICEMARRLGISRNSVRKYLSLLSNNDSKDQPTIDNTTIAERAYQNDSMSHDAQRLEQLMQHFKYAEHDWVKQELPGSYCGRNTCYSIRMGMFTAIIVITLILI